nr:hypothetical protein [uncultured Brevundimonas sp.]
MAETCGISEEDVEWIMRKRKLNRQAIAAEKVSRKAEEEKIAAAQEERIGKRIKWLSIMTVGGVAALVLAYIVYAVWSANQPFDADEYCRPHENDPAAYLECQASIVRAAQNQ